MRRDGPYDAVVVGSGPNGLAAAVELARAGCSVLVLEACDSPGGGTRSSELTLPGFVHDVCSAVHPLAVASPCLRALPLADHGLEWVHPEAPLAHPLDDGTAVLLQRSVEATSEGLGPDGASWRRVLGRTARDWPLLEPALLGPPRIPRHPVAACRFALRALRSARGLARSLFREARARALFAGLSAHSMLPLERPATAGFGLVLGAVAHAWGWPFPKGGAGRIADALVSLLRSLGGEVVTSHPVRGLRDVPPARAVLFDLTPRQLLEIAGDRLPPSYRKRLRAYRYGCGAFKMDWALDGPVPWSAPECSRAGTLHLGGTMEEVAASERSVGRGRTSERPFVLVAQTSLFDGTRAPEGRHTLWGYCHVPNGSHRDMARRMEAQVERFAPGFRDRVLARSVLGPAALEAHDANFIGGDINGGVQDIAQILARPVARLDPYATPGRGIFLCSSSTPPGGGVHGMCGFHAARSALRRLRRMRTLAGER